MHNGDRDWTPEWSGLVSCGHWMMPMLWSGGRADKISNKLAGDVACLGGSMVEHQPRLLGSRVRFPAGAFAIFFRFCQSFTSNFPFPFSFPFLFLSLPLPFPFPLPPTFRCAKKRVFAFIPPQKKKLWVLVLDLDFYLLSASSSFNEHTSRIMYWSTLSFHDRLLVKILEVTVKVFTFQSTGFFMCWQGVTILCSELTESIIQHFLLEHCFSNKRFRNQSCQIQGHLPSIESPQWL